MLSPRPLQNINVVPTHLLNLIADIAYRMNYNQGNKPFRDEYRELIQLPKLIFVVARRMGVISFNKHVVDGYKAIDYIKENYHYDDFNNFSLKFFEARIEEELINLEGSKFFHYTVNQNNEIAYQSPALLEGRFTNTHHHEKAAQSVAMLLKTTHPEFEALCCELLSFSQRELLDYTTPQN